MNPLKWLLSPRYRYLYAKLRDKDSELWMMQVGIDFLNFEFGERELDLQRLRKKNTELETAPRPERRRTEDEIEESIRKKVSEKTAIENSRKELMNQLIWHTKERDHMETYLRAFDISKNDIR